MAAPLLISLTTRCASLCPLLYVTIIFDPLAASIFAVVSPTPLDPPTINARCAENVF